MEIEFPFCFKYGAPQSKMSSKYIMYNVQDYNVLYNNAVRPVKCDG